MKSDIPLDYAVFQLSPRRSRCELFVSYDGTTEKLASGLVKPFVTHLTVAEEQVALSAKSIKLEVNRREAKAETWFTKGTLERFVRFVSTPEILEMVHTFDAEMSQLEAARRIYSQGTEDSESGADGTGGASTTSDATKKELVRAIDVRLVAVRQDLVTACTRAAAAGFNSDTASELQLFADQFGAKRLSEACTKFSSLCLRRPDLLNSWKPNVEDRALRSSSGSDMSIDDPADDPQTVPRYVQQQHPEQLGSATLQLPSIKQPSSVTLPLRRSSSMSANNDSKVSDHKDNDADKDKREEAEPERSSIQASQPTRRLSVQDRINMFESKQKENSTTSGSGGKPVVGKSVELRRLSSDISSGVEKAVLRRWSGASDMSIDLSSERREPDSNAGTPTSSVVFPAKPLPRSLSSTSMVNTSLEKEQKESNDLGGSSILGAKGDSKASTAGGGSSDSGLKDQVDSKDADESKEVTDAKTSGTTYGKTPVAVVSGSVSDFGSSDSKLPSVSGRSDNVALKDQSFKRIHRSRASIGGAEDFGQENQTTGQTQLKSFLGKSKTPVSADHAAGEKVNVGFGAEEQTVVVEKAASESQIKEIRGDVAPKDHFVQKPHTVVSESRTGAGQSDAEDSQVLASDVSNMATLNQQVHRSQLRASQRAPVEAPKSDTVDQSDSKVANPDLVGARPKSKSFTGLDEENKGDPESLEKQHDPSPAEVQHSSTQRMKSQKQSLVSDHGKKTRGRRDNIGPVVANNQAGLVDGSASQSEGVLLSTSKSPFEQVQRSRQSKGLNDDLKLKANELEKLFAEHKLRVPGDQSNISRRSKPIDMSTQQEPDPLHSGPESVALLSQSTSVKMLAESSKSLSEVNDFDTTPPMKALDNQYYDSTPKQNVYSLSFSDDSKGKFYDKYMQKRDAKLREEWSLKRSEKEARMKAMHDSLERSRAELNTKLAGSSDGRDSASNARHRAEKLRSLSARATRRQQHIESYMSDEDEDQTDFSGLKLHRQDGMSSDGSSRGTQTKKVSPNKSATSSTPRSLGVAASRSSMKTSNASAGRRKLQSENPLAQSVPNFSDLRKENTKPSLGSSKTTTRIPVRNYGRTKSGSEEKPGMSQSLRKASANPVTPTEVDGADLRSLKSDKEDTEGTYEFSSNLGMAPFMNKGNGLGNVSFSGIVKSKSSQIITLNNGDDDSTEIAKAEDDFIMVGEDCHSADKVEPRLSQGSYKSLNSGSGNSDVVRCVSQADSSSVSELPLVTEPTYHAIGPAQDSPGESPISWNAHSHNLYSFSNEISDIDASVDSPIGSPAYWNSHSIGHTETEAARMRKKWGAAQKPIVAADPSHGHSRKDVTKGFKRFLKFGRKHRGAESGADWISATTSEGDDDTEDGREQANRSSEDLRKSRMGFLQGRTSDDGFNETDFNEQVQAFQSSIPVPPSNFKLRDEHLSGSSLKAPRSFFSLPSFRSKGSDPKPR